MSDPKDTEPLPASDLPATAPVRRPWWSVSRWVELLILGVLLLLVFLFVAGPFLPTGSQKARRAEGEQLLGSAVDGIRVQMSKTNRPPTTISSFLAEFHFRGEHFKVSTVIYTNGRPVDQRDSLSKDARWVIVAVPIDPEDGWGVMTFQADRWEREVEWFDEKPAWIRD